MISDAYVTVTCDWCNVVDIDIQLSATARRGWNELDVDSRLEAMGWTVMPNTILCPNCSEAFQEAE